MQLGGRVLDGEDLGVDLAQRNGLLSPTIDKTELVFGNEGMGESDVVETEPPAELVEPLAASPQDLNGEDLDGDGLDPAFEVD